MIVSDTGPLVVLFIEAAMSKARYEIIEDEEPYYGEVPELEGVWATGKTLEECRKNLAEVIDGWMDCSETEKGFTPKKIF